MSGSLRDRFKPSSITLWGWDPMELQRYQLMMSYSIGRIVGTPTEFIELLNRRWYVSNIEWQGTDDIGSLIYEITLTAIMEV